MKLHAGSQRERSSRALIAFAFRALFAVFPIVLMTADAIAQTLELPAMHQLRDADKFRAAVSSPEEAEQILAQIQETSFDWPDSWESELRARRVSLGNVDGLIVQGSKLLCGGSGNCQTWIFASLQKRWTALFGKEAPIVAGFGFLQTKNSGVSDLVTDTNAGGGRDSYIVFGFDGSHYQALRCYERTADGGNKPAPIAEGGKKPESIKAVRCAPSRDPAAH
jgi:hypothetical protein